MDERINIISNRMRNKNLQFQKMEMNSKQYFNALAEEAIKALDEYYGAARYWMSARFERDSVVREIRAALDKIERE